MLGVQNSWKVADTALQYLITEYDLSIDFIMNCDQEELSKHIGKCVHHNVKAKYIKGTT